MSDRLSTLHGVSAIMILDVTTENTYANAVFPAGIIVRKSDNIFYLTDGTRALAQLSPIVDQVLNTNEKTALANAFSSNNYVRTANGVVVHNGSGKIDDASLNLVSNGKLKVSYLSDFVENNLIKYAKLPDAVKQGFYVVNTYADLVTLDADQRKKLIVVRDASGDPVGNITGSGMYYYNNNTWQSIIAVADTSLTAEDIQALGAVMYNHMIHVTTTNSNIRTVLNKLVIGEAIPAVPEGSEEPVDTSHNEDSDYTELGWTDFVDGLNTVTNSSSSDVYLTAKNDSSSDIIYFKIITHEGFELDLANTTVVHSLPSTDTTITLTGVKVVENDDAIGVCEYNWVEGEIADGIYAIANTDNSVGDHYTRVSVTVTDGVHIYTAGYMRFMYQSDNTNNHRHLPDLDIRSGTDWEWQKIE